jgi:hypothetical protein
MKRLALAAVLLIASIAAALAQSPVSVIGPITPGDCAAFSSNTVVKDGGFPCPGSGGTLNLPNGTTATTQPLNDNTTKVATDAFVQNQIGAIVPVAPGGVSGNVQFNNAGTFGGLTNTQLTADINTFTAGLSGAVPPSGGGTTNFLRADGTFANPGAGLPTIANGHLIANATGGPATAQDTAPSTWFDSAYCNTVGYVIVRLTGAWTCSNNFPRNVVWFGADPTGVAASDTAYNNAYTSLSSIGGSIYFPTGNYSFTSAISKTLPNAQFSITLEGDGSTGTVLNWPNASGGITFTASNIRNTFHVKNLTFTTTQVGSGTALSFSGLGGNNGQFFQSDIHNVQVNGDDIGTATPTLHYWGIAIKIHNWSAVDVSNVNTYGPHQAPASAGGGVGLIYEGNSGTSSFSTILNISRSSFNFHTTGIQLNDFWQGVTIDQANFNGEVGGSCISQTGGATGTLVLLTVTNSQFNCAGAQIAFSSAVLNPTFIGNTISVFGNNQSGINTGASGSSGLIVIGNVFNLAGAFTGTFCIVYGGAGGVILGNMFNSCATPVNLEAASTNVGVSQNRYVSAGANINNGAGNNLGTVTQ